MRETIRRLAVGTVPEEYTGGIPSDVFDLYGTPRYSTKQLEGFGRPEGSVYISDSVNDFSNYQRVSIKQRELNFDLVVNGSIGRNLELLYQNLPYNQLIRVYVVDAKGTTVYIDGAVEKLELTCEAGSRTVVDVSIICPFPWWRSVHRNEVELSGTAETLRTSGDIDAGIEVYLSGSVSAFKLYTEDESFTISGTHTFTDDYPAMCSVEGEHTTYDYTGTPLWANVASGSEWIQVTARTGIELDANAVCTVYWHDHYSGVAV